jgi:uncharacterized protein YcbX
METSDEVVGTVVSLWRYPVKSMQGEELNASEVSKRGLLGDRAYALIDSADGKIGSAKNPRKWPGLFDYRAAFANRLQTGAPVPPVRITLPDGTVVDSDQEDIDRVLSNAIGRAVALSSAAPSKPVLEEYWPDLEGLAHRDTTTDETMASGLFFDAAHIHLLTTATLDCLREFYPQGRFEVRRFRPNIVLATPPGAKGFVEDGWTGRTLALGSDVRLQITVPCSRCVMTTLSQADLPADPTILRTAARHNQANVGVYARIVASGRLRRGDAARLNQ